MLQSPPTIIFDHVSRLFATADGREVTALQDVSFNIGMNEFLVVVGPSGCGKSTLLRLIAGLIAPTQGRVAVSGAPVVRPLDNVGIVFQRPTLLPWLDILSNVTFPKRHKYGRVSDQDRQVARNLLQLVGLSDFAGSRPDELSGGMQQRAAIARALFLDPEILLMDEPFSSLDALSRDEMAFELLQIWSKRPKTVVFITHSITEAVLLADRVMVMSARPGTIAEEVPIPLARPRSMDTLTEPLFNEIAASIRNSIFRRNRAA
jgi:NitT/TauT family transport system ATP-binding protein